MFFSIKLQKFFPSNSNPVFRFEEQIPRIPSVFRDSGKSLALHQAEIFKGKLSTIVIFIPCKLCVNL